MKVNLSTLIAAATLITGLMLPVRVAAQHTRYKLVDIGTLGGPVSFPSEDANESRILNNQGTVAGGADLPEADPYAPNCFEPDCFVHHAFRWKNGVMTDLGALAGGASAVGGINEQGWVAGFSWTGEFDPLLNGPAAHAVLWKDDQILDLGTLSGTESNAVYVGDGGQVVGFATINGPPDPFGFFGLTVHTFLWENGVMQDVGTLGGPDSFPGYGCANLGNALPVGAADTSWTPNANTGLPTTDPFLWENGKMHDLGTLGGTFGLAQCANNRHQVIGISDLAGDQNHHAFLWERGAMTDLGTLGGDNSNAVAIADSGVVVGNAELPGSQTHHGFLWRQGVMTDLGSLYGEPCSNGRGVNNRGQVVGDTTDCTGLNLHAFFWENGGPMVDLNTLIPPNSSLRLLVAFNINDRGEIAGVGVPQGVPPQDRETRAHVFLLIPCTAHDHAGCDAAADGTAVSTQAHEAAIISTNQGAAPAIKIRPTASESVALLRARLARQHHARR